MKTDLPYSVIDGGRVRIAQPRKYAGYWLIGGVSNAGGWEAGIKIMLQKRPRWLTRVLLAWLIEWHWHDSE